MERRRETSEITIIDNNVEMDDNDDDDYENNERLNKIPTLGRHQILFFVTFSCGFLLHNYLF